MRNAHYGRGQMRVWCIFCIKIRHKIMKGEMGVKSSSHKGTRKRVPHPQSKFNLKCVCAVLLKS